MFWIWILGCATDNTCAEIEDATFPATDATVVTVGVYTQDDPDCYVDTGKTLVFEVNASCHVWTRTSQGHDINGDLEAVDGVHDHFNAGDDMSYVDGVFTWTEYGPEHNQEAIEATCANGEAGVVKSVTATDYFEDHGGLFLRIIDVE